MTDRTDAIKAAISATAPSELQWLPNPGHEPEIPDGWEFAGVEYANGDRIVLDEAAEPSAWAWDFINHRSDLRHYAIRRKPTQPNQTPTLAEMTPVTEDAHELRKRAVLLALNGNWARTQTIAARIGEPAFHVLIAIRALCASGDVAQSVDDDGWPVFRLNTDTPMVNIFEPEPIRKQSGALVISGRLTAVGERFAGIDSSGQQITLSINTEQARWLGRYVGGEVKLTVEVVL